MASAWIILPADSPQRWGAVALYRTALEDAGYVVETYRGAGPVVLRLAGSALGPAALWRDVP